MWSHAGTRRFLNLLGTHMEAPKRFHKNKMYSIAQKPPIWSNQTLYSSFYVRRTLQVMSRMAGEDFRAGHFRFSGSCQPSQFLLLYLRVVGSLVSGCQKGVCVCVSMYGAGSVFYLRVRFKSILIFYYCVSY